MGEKNLSRKAAFDFDPHFFLLHKLDDSGRILAIRKHPVNSNMQIFFFLARNSPPLGGLQK
jgi:hypothetical protein